MYAAIDNSRLPPSLRAYLDSPFVASCEWDGKFLARLDESSPFKRVYPGLHSTLRRKYYPRRKKRRWSSHSKVQCSTKKEGIRVHNEVFQYVKKGTPPKHYMARAVLHYLEITLSHDLVASEVPVYIAPLKCMTQVDLITVDYFTDKMHMWELKCGRGTNTRNHGKPILKNVPNTHRNHWELQRHYSLLGLERGGVKIAASNVINVYKKEKNVEVKVINAKKWTQKLPS